MARMIRPAKRDIDELADSHAGDYDGFSVKFLQMLGWFVVFERHIVGPFHTSQAAFGAVKDAIDEEVRG